MDQEHIRWISYALSVLVPYWIAFGSATWINKDEKLNMLIGGAIGCLMNWYLYSVQVGGSRPSNIVNVFSKRVKGLRGNNEWFARVDSPHGKVNYHHINANPRITRRPDPHDRLSRWETILARIIARFLKWIEINMGCVKLLLLIAVVGKYYNNESKEEIWYEIIAIGVGGFATSWIGAEIGTFIFPGIGTLLYTIFGGAIGGGVVGKICQFCYR